MTMLIGQYMKHFLGFTLIELLITMSVMAVLFAMAYPSYRTVTIKVRRSDAQVRLSSAQLKESEYHITHAGYITDLRLLGLPTAQHFYQFSVVSTSQQGYLLKATVKRGTSQAHDTLVCQTLLIDQDDNKTSDGEHDNASCWQK